MKLQKSKQNIVIIFLLFFLLAPFFAPLGVDAEGFKAPINSRQVDSASGSGGGLVGAAADQTLGRVFNFVTGILVSISQGILNIAGSLLEVSLTYSIRSESFKFDGIKNAWTIIRDVANITFIFILLYIAIATILQLGGVNTKRILATLIVVALFINFSFFLAGTVIDAGNILALTLYQSITQNGTVEISEQFARFLQIETLYDAATFTKLYHFQKGISNILSAIVLLIAAFVFLSAAILFVLRTIVLMFVLVLSPITFAAAVLPGTAHYFKKWLHNLINYSFVAPFYLLGLLVVLNILPGMITFTGSDKYTLAGVGQLPGEETITIVLAFFLVAGILIGVLNLARGMAGGIGNLSVKWAGKVTGAGMGGAASLGRLTGGWAAKKLHDSEWLKNQVKEGGRLGKYAALKVKSGAEKVSRASFDVRSTGLAGLAGAQLGTNFGRPGGRGGYEERKKQKIRERAETADWLRKTKKSKEDTEEIATAEGKLTEAQEQLAEARKREQELREKGAYIDIAKAKEEVEKREAAVKSKEEDLAQAKTKAQTRGIARQEEYLSRFSPEDTEVIRKYIKTSADEKSIRAVLKRMAKEGEIDMENTKKEEEKEAGK